MIFFLNQSNINITHHNITYIALILLICGVKQRLRYKYDVRILDWTLLKVKLQKKLDKDPHPDLNHQPGGVTLGPVLV